MNYLQEQLISEGFKIIEEETTILTEEEAKEVEKTVIKKPKDIDKIKNPKTKRKLAARLIGATAIATGIPTAKAAAMMAKNSDAAGDLFTAQTTINLADKAVRELSKNDSLKNSLTKLGVKGARSAAENMRDYSSFSHDSFAMWTSSLIGKLASSILRIKNLFMTGDGTAVTALGSILGEEFNDHLKLKQIQPGLFEFQDEDGTHMAPTVNEIPTNRPFKKTEKFAYIGKTKYNLYEYQRHYKLVRCNLNEEVLEEDFKETFKNKILPILQVTGILGTMLGSTVGLGFGIKNETKKLKNQIHDIVYNQDHTYTFNLIKDAMNYDPQKGVLTINDSKTIKVPEKAKQEFNGNIVKENYFNY